MALQSMTGNYISTQHRHGGKIFMGEKIDRLGFDNHVSGFFTAALTDVEQMAIKNLTQMSKQHALAILKIRSQILR